MLISFFIPLRRAEAITWENFVLAKQDPNSTKERSRLARMNFLHMIARYNLWKIYNTGQKTGQHFIPANRNHVITTLILNFQLSFIFFWIRRCYFACRDFSTAVLHSQRFYLCCTCFTRIFLMLYYCNDCKNVARNYFRQDVCFIVCFIEWASIRNFFLVETKVNSFILRMFIENSLGKLNQQSSSVMINAFVLFCSFILCYLQSEKIWVVVPQN